MAGEKAHKVSAIIANWNGAHHLGICLPSLLAQTVKSLEIVVVDNGSTDNSEQVAREAGVKWLGLHQNRGLAPALNRGAGVAAGDTLLFVNNDMRFHEAFVENLLKPLEGNPKIFATDGMQFNWDGSVRGHLAARLTQRKPRGKPSVELVPGLHFYQHQENEKTPVFTGSAACMLVRRTLFESLNGFDERLPLGYEDVEICWRAWLRDWETIFVPSAICWHHIGGSSRSVEAIRFNFRGVLTGRLLFATKLLPFRYAILTWLVSVAAIVKDLTQSRWTFARERLKTVTGMVSLAPQLLRERKSLFANAQSSPDRHLSFLLRLTDQGRL